MNFVSLVLRGGIVRCANSSYRMPTPRIPTSTSEAMDDLSYEVIDAALEVQHLLGPALLRSAYEAAVAHEMKLRDLKIDQRLPADLRAATLSITNNDSDESPFNFSIQGIGYTATEVTVVAWAESQGISGPAAAPAATPFNDDVSNVLKNAMNMPLTGPRLPAPAAAVCPRSPLPTPAVRRPPSASSTSAVSAAA